MKIGILKELQKGEKRVSLSPFIAKKLVTNGFEVFIEKNAGNKQRLFKKCHEIKFNTFWASFPALITSTCFSIWLLQLVLVIYR